MNIKNSVNLALALSSFGAFAGGAFAVLTVEMSWRYFMFGASDGFWIGGFMAAYTIFVVRGPFGRTLRKQSFMFKVLMNSLAYVLLFFVGRGIGHWVQGRSSQMLWDTQFVSSIGFAVVLALLVNFIMEMSQLVGSKAVWNFVRGIYHRPIEEDRVFMFVDLASSTTIAEKIGNQQFLNLLNLFFSSLSEASSHTGAEIYKYVGDEAILTWPASEAAKDNRALECFFRFQKNLYAVRSEFESRFDLVPEFRGALHRGVVVAGELGEARKEIAYLGDVVNTTARLMETARDHKVKLAVSENFLELYGSQRSSQYEYAHLGHETLRGKDETISVFSVTSKS